jgi:hypothetical protein
MLVCCSDTDPALVWQSVGHVDSLMLLEDQGRFANFSREFLIENVLPVSAQCFLVSM